MRSNQEFSTSHFAQLGTTNISALKINLSYEGWPSMPYTFPCKSRSRFLNPIIKELRKHGQNLSIGQPVVVQLDDEKGYKGTYQCKTKPEARIITVDFHYEDKTRFPARIKAAAIALCREEFAGTFEISHEKGRLTIRSL